MITAVDTNVLLDVLGADRTFGERSARALRKCMADGALVACDVVFAETGASFPTQQAAAAALSELRVDFSPPDARSALTAGDAWRTYRRSGGTRERVIADFLIGAHARISADQLLTRDRGFYRRYFEDLHVIDPSRD